METQNFDQNFKVEIGEKISQIRQTVLEISKLLLLPWQPFLGLSNFTCFHEFQREIVSLLKLV